MCDNKTSNIGICCKAEPVSYVNSAYSTLNRLKDEVHEISKLLIKNQDLSAGEIIEIKVKIGRVLMEATDIQRKMDTLEMEYEGSKRK